MRFKRVPAPPADVETLDAARLALPRVPDTEADCCRRLRERLDLEDRDAGRAWLTFLRALGLARPVDGDYVRAGTMPAPDELRGTFRDRVFAAREALDAVAASGPVEADEVFDRLRDRVPAWERGRDPAWEATWRERTRRLLEWAVLLGLLERTDAGYVPVE